jgi:hypothetical protein
MLHLIFFYTKPFRSIASPVKEIAIFRRVLQIALPCHALLHENCVTQIAYTLLASMLYMQNKIAIAAILRHSFCKG